MEKNKFYEIKCDSKTRKGKMRPGGRVCNQYLGEIQIDVPNISKHRCHLCNITYRHTVDANGIVSRDIPKTRTVYTEAVARLDI